MHLARFRLMRCVMYTQPIFVGGSRNGTPVRDAGRRAFTFVDGYLMESDEQGALTIPINATVELYVREELSGSNGEFVSVYFLVDLDEKQRKERLEQLLAA